MCGICGLVALNGSEVDATPLAAMSESLRHRGPDSEGSVVDGPVALAARRLSIIDLEGGDQPVGNEDGSVKIVQNGEIYNYRELRAGLERRGHRFSTQSDTEVLVHLYEEHGPTFVRELRGMFALALWDSRQRRLVLARDRFGIKPLYYGSEGGLLSFASELKALPRGEVDLDALEAFLTFNSIPAPLSIWRGTLKLPAGHLLVWEGKGEPRLERFARPAPVPAGEVRNGKESELAKRYDTNHHELVLKPDAAELLPKLAAAFDEPFADSSALPTYLVSELASRHVKVALSGEGGDELFGGYYTYVADLLAPRVGPLAGVIRPLVEALPSSSRRTSFDYKAKRFVRAAHLPPLERHHAFKEILSPEARAELLAHGRRGSADPLDAYRARYEETEGAEPLARLQDVDLGIYLVDDLLVKTDRARMAQSHEARVPYLDEVVAGFALALPTRLKVRGLAKKRLLRKAVAPLLPHSVVYGKKRGFSIPAAAWLRGPLVPFAREVLSAETVRRQGYFSPETVTRLLEDHIAGREDLSRQLWGLLSFTLWCEQAEHATALAA